jgi:hypothetical protein
MVNLFVNVGFKLFNLKNIAYLCIVIKKLLIYEKIQIEG